jgi:hypothetical protein
LCQSDKSGKRGLSQFSSNLVSASGSNLSAN